VKVRSTISGADGSTVTPAAKGKTVEQLLQTNVAADASSVRVETHSLDAHGDQVGTGYTEVVKLPSEP
jgi:hypothetical protein